MSVVNWVIDHYVELINIACYVVTIASVIVKWTKTKKDDAFVAKLLNWLSLAKK